MQRRIRVAVNGYGVIGKRLAQAVTMQDDMSLAGVSDVVSDWRARTVVRNGFRLFGATGDAVSAMHVRALIHRDLKPENVMLVAGPTGEHAVLLDFGIAKLASEGVAAPTQSGLVRGTSSSSGVGSSTHEMEFVYEQL